MTSEQRKNEIAFVVDLVQKLCVEAEIGLVATERKGQLMVVVEDARDGQIYYIGRNDKK